MRPTDNEETNDGVSRETTQPRPIGEFLRWLGDDAEPFTCSVCGLDWVKLRGGEGDTCPDCAAAAQRAARVKLEAERIQAGVAQWFPHWLQRAGLSPMECTARMDKMPPQVNAALHDPAVVSLVRDMVAGKAPDRGFGISGGAGTGKTFALAALFKTSAYERIRARVHTEGREALRHWFTWVRWPEETAKMRTDVARYDDGMAAADRRARELIAAEALVLDDLGAERIKGGDYSDDWATSVLDRIVDARFNSMRQTWWTSNLAPREFAERYGARLWSRLAGGSPVVVLKPGPDLRLARRGQG